jgi:hypothetical protein
MMDRGLRHRIVNQRNPEWEQHSSYQGSNQNNNTGCSDNNRRCRRLLAFVPIDQRKRDYRQGEKEGTKKQCRVVRGGSGSNQSARFDE